MCVNSNDPNLITQLLRKVDFLERRVEQLEESQIDPKNLVTFTTVAVSGKMGLHPIEMQPIFSGPAPIQVGIFGKAAYKHNLVVMDSLAILHKIYPSR